MTSTASIILAVNQNEKQFSFISMIIILLSYMCIYTHNQYNRPTNRRCCFPAGHTLNPHHRAGRHALADSLPLTQVLKSIRALKLPYICLKDLKDYNYEYIKSMTHYYKYF